MSAVAQLYALQQVDLAIESRKNALQEAEAKLGSTEELDAAREEAAATKEALRVAEQNFKEREQEANDLMTKIEPLEKKLYQGTILNPKELDDLQHDIESLKRRRSQLDDQAIEAMDALEVAQREHKEASEQLDELERDSQAGQTKLRAEMAALEAEIAEQQSERDEEASEIDPELLKLYDRIASIRQGRAVAKVEGGACQGCRISLPSSLVQRARGSSSIVQCTSCERILYVS
jgi:predicted  nucleic acid-binding Zn-ribbon protein